MAMGNIIATAVDTGTVDFPQYNVGVTAEIYTRAVTTALASGDTIAGPTLPANCYLLDVWVDAGAIGSGATAKVGYAGAGNDAAFIASGTAIPGAITHANVPGALGFSATTDTKLILTMTGTAGAPAAGTIRIAIMYTPNP